MPVAPNSLGLSRYNKLVRPGSQEYIAEWVDNPRPPLAMRVQPSNRLEERNHDY